MECCTSPFSHVVCWIPHKLGDTTCDGGATASLKASSDPSAPFDEGLRVCHTINSVDHSKEACVWVDGELLALGICEYAVCCER